MQRSRTWRSDSTSASRPVHGRLGHRGPIGLFLLLGAGALLPVACSSNRENLHTDVPDLVGPDGGDVETGAACGFRCSRDLKKVLKGCDDSPDNVVAECPPDQGCGVDSCVSACDAAALSKGSAGCGFWTLPPDDGTNGEGSCFAAMVANTWDRSVTISAEWGKEALDISNSVYTATTDSGQPIYTKLDGPLPAGQVALVFLAQSKPSGLHHIACPAGVTPAVTVDPIAHGTTRTKAFHLTTDAPVAAYSIFPYGGAEGMFPSATVLLPESSWDKTYFGVTVGLFGDLRKATKERRTMQIVATDDDTRVVMRPTFDVLPGDGVDPAAAGDVGSWTLQRGEVLQITQAGLASGTPIQADKPIGLFGGAPCSFIPVEYGYCDMFQQQIPPLSQWGTEFALVPYLTRVIPVGGQPPSRENVAWSMVGAVDGTELTWSPSKPPGAPDRLSAGQTVNFLTDAITAVKSQGKTHPFQASVYMTGSTIGAGVIGSQIGRTLGDPEFVNLVPTDQYLDRYVFFADYTFSETSLTVVRRKHGGSFSPVTLECGEISGWQPIGDGAEYEYAWVQLTAGSLPVPLPGGNGACGYGRHVAESEGPFSLTVWGIGRDASYGYAGGMGSRPVNEAIITVQ
jgi:hypothetical protein